MIADNRHTKEKISELQEDCDTEEEEETETLLYKKRSFDDFERLFQVEPREGEVVYACNVCDEGLDTENDVKKHIYIHTIRTFSRLTETNLKMI